VSGRIVLMLELSEAGKVLSVEIDSSDLPEFEDFVASAVRSWRFTPPTRGGRPVEAWARLPIPIRVR
jgi:TonB family protein